MIVINGFDVTDFSVRNVSQNYFFEANFPLRDYSRFFQQLGMGKGYKVRTNVQTTKFEQFEQSSNSLNKVRNFLILTSFEFYAFDKDM